MTKDIEKLSAWYDGEISKEDFDKGLENLGSSPESKKILHQYAILSELMQRIDEYSYRHLVVTFGSI